MEAHPLVDDVSFERRPSKERSASTMRGLPANTALHGAASGSQTRVQTNETTPLTGEPSKQGCLNERAL